MLSREEEFILTCPDDWIYCADSEELIVKGCKFEPITKIKDSKGNHFYWRPGGWTLNYDKQIDTSVVIQPKGVYCCKCLQIQDMTERTIMYDDGEPVQFWDQCEDCKLASSRGYAAKKWTTTLKRVDPELNHTRFATFTTKNPTFKLKDLGFSWDFHDEELFKTWLMINCRKFTRKGVTRLKYLGNMPEIISKENIRMRDKLKLRLKNMRHKHKRFKKKVLGGIVCYEATMNIIPETMELELHPHLHAIIHGRYYDQKELQEDWGLGIVHIRKITNKWKALLEISKYIGKDGSRRTAWGSIRKERSKELQEMRNKTELINQQSE